NLSGIRISQSDPGLAPLSSGFSVNVFFTNFNLVRQTGKSALPQGVQGRRATHVQPLLQSEEFECRLNSRATSTPRNNWPPTASRIAKPRATSVFGTISP